MKTKVVNLSDETHTALTVEMSKSGMNRKAIVDKAIKFYLDYKNSERLLNKVGR